MRGKAYYAIGDADLAKTHFREALKLDPEHKGCKEAHKLLRKVLKLRGKASDALKNGKWELAIDNLRELVESDPSHIPNVLPAFCDLSKAFSQLSRFDEAQQEAENAIRIQESSPLGHLQLGKILMAKEKYEEAIRSFKV